jgi:homoserine kinase type II
MHQSWGLLVGSVIGVDDARWMLDNSGLAGLERIEPLEGGWDNTSVLLTLKDGGFVVLKAWFANTVEEVARVIERHCHLDSHGIPTPVPFRLEGGRMLAEKDGVAWTLLPYFSGGILDSDEESLRSLGEVQAKMHMVPTSECFPDVYTMGFGLFEQILSIGGEWESHPFLELLENEVPALREGVSPELPSGILHGDLFPDNVIGSGGEVSAILDLEEAWIGPLAFDLAMSFVGFGWEDGRPVESRWVALVEGYQSVRSLTSAEVSALPVLHRYSTLSIACWRFWKHNISIPDYSLSDRYREMVDRLKVDFDLRGAF